MKETKAERDIVEFSERKKYRFHGNISKPGNLSKSIQVILRNKTKIQNWKQIHRLIHIITMTFPNFDLFNITSTWWNQDFCWEEKLSGCKQWTTVYQWKSYSFSLHFNFIVYSFLYFMCFLSNINIRFLFILDSRTFFLLAFPPHSVHFVCSSW